MFGRKKQKSSNFDYSSASQIYFHEDHQFKTLNEALVGRKGFSLFKLKDLDLPVPDFFVISPVVFKDMLVSAFGDKIDTYTEKVKNPDLKEITNAIKTANFSLEFREELLKMYARLSGFSNAWVAVRSSIVYPSSPETSFSGVYKSDLNIKGLDDLMSAIKEVYISMFTDSSLIYAKNNEVSLADLQMSVVVQRMVQPEVSGVAYTVDPITNDRTKLSVEAVFGLGDVIADGDVTPDQYIVEKSKLAVLEKHIAPQEWMKIRKLTASKNQLERFEKIKISKAWSHQQKLEDRYVEDVAKIAMIIEDRLNASQHIEWVFESGRVWILQNKSLNKQHVEPKVVTAPVEQIQAQAPIDIAIAAVKEKSEQLLQTQPEQTEVKQAETSNPESVQKTLSEKELKSLDRWKKRLDLFNVKKENKDLEIIEKSEAKEDAQISETDILTGLDEKSMEFVISAIGASHGESVGIVKVINEKNLNFTVTKNSILLFEKYTGDLEPLVYKSAGVIAVHGGLTSDISILCREAGVPAVVGADKVLSHIKDGEIVKIDGNVGSIYKFSTSKAADANQSPKVNDLEVLKASEKSSLRKQESVLPIDANDKSTETIVVAPNKSLPVTALKVYTQPDLSEPVHELAKYIHMSNGIATIDLDSLMLMDKRHPLSHVENKTFKEYSKKLEILIDSYCEVARGEEVIVSIGSAPISSFRSLIKGSAMEESELPDRLNGAQRYLNNKKLLTKALQIIKKLRNTYQNRNISLAVHSPMSGNIMTEIKKEISASGLRRTSTFKIYAVIENPSEIILAKEIVETGIDGVIFNAPAVASMMQGSLTGKNTYNLEDSSLLNSIDLLVNSVKQLNCKVLMITESNETLISKAVNSGVYAITVKPNELEDSRKKVAAQEAKVFMKIGRK